MGAYDDDIEAFKLRAEFLRESLKKSQDVTGTMISILGSFDNRLSTLETAMRPTQVKTHAFRKAHENIDGTLEAAKSVLHQFEISRQVENKVLEGPKSDFGGFLAACDELHKNVEYLMLNRSLKASDTALNQARDLFNVGMSRLEEEFRVLLTNNSKPADPDRLMKTLPIPGKPAPPEAVQNGGGEEVKLLLTNTPYNDKALNPPVLPVLMSPKVVPQLAEMAQRLVAAGLHQQCLKTYREVRASNLEQSLRELGVERLSKDDIMKMPWESLEGKITNWIQYMRIAIKLLFSTERKLCDQIWAGLDPHREKCFADVTDSSVHMLLSFGEAIAKSKKTPEKLFVLLDMYETMRDLQPEIEQVFSGDAATGMREAATGLIRKLGQTAKDTFADFEDAVDKDATKTLVLDGTVHMLTSYVINYVKFLLDYQNTLNELFSVGALDDKTSHLAAATKRIMKVLQTNLEGKAKLYKDPALAHLFLMNNIHYMVKSVRRSEAKDMLGDDWVQIQRRVVQQHGISYQRAAWNKVLQFITGSGGASSGDSGISKSQLKERLKGFSLTFEDLYLRQTQWTIPDNELREAVRLQVQEIILPAYRSFLKRYSAMIEGKQSVNKYLKYNPDDLERMLHDLFEGKQKQEPRVR
jgi:exocyst complex protein 7